jgi:hypothetical protein
MTTMTGSTEPVKEKLPSPLKGMAASLFVVKESWQKTSLDKQSSMP